MMKQAYLTIDDTPSSSSKVLINFLSDHKIPALLFVRGDLLEQNRQPVIEAIERGLVIGNHLFSHRRSSALSFEEISHEIQRTENLIDSCYSEAGYTRPGKYLRFPHIDRGAGGWIVDFKAHPDHAEILQSIFLEGLNTKKTEPTSNQKAKKDQLQGFLKREGFEQPFQNIHFPWWIETELKNAKDCLYTYSTCDWMLTKRHFAKDWPCKTLADLEKRVDTNAVLKDTISPHILLMHDQDELIPVTIHLIEYFIQNGWEFCDIV